MPLLTALAISIGALGGIATFLFLGPLAASGVQLWCVFLAWACFYHVGGAEKGILTTVVQMIFGAACGWAAFFVITHVPLANAIGLPAWAGICVGLSVVVLVLAANVPALSVIPASVYGYAAIAAYFLLVTVPAKDLGGPLLAPSMANPLIAVAASAVVGALFGWVSQKIGMILNASAVRQARTA